MTDPLSITLAVAAAGVAILAGVLHWPRPPALDGERWFKVVLATLLRGAIEERGGTADEWEAEVLRFVPYHPAGRLPELKVTDPAKASLPGRRLEGEGALLEALARRHTVAERWRYLYDEDPMGIAARLDDPAELGADYDPATWLPAGVGWDALAAWGGGDPAFGECLQRRFPARWVLVEGRAGRRVGPTLLDALEACLDDTVRLPWRDGAVEEAVEALRAELRAQIASREDRLVLVAEEAGVALALRALAGAPDIRDQIHAVLSIGGVIGGRRDEEGPFGEERSRAWLASQFGQEALDTEVVRLTPYLSMQWLDRESPVPGAGDLSLDAQRFPEPLSDATVDTIEVVDLGPLPVDPDLPREQVARALVSVVTCWVLSRR